jgi:4-hydroxybenzoate polyprenyltransferase
MQASLLKRLWNYQQERFPLLILSSTTLSVVLSTYAIITTITKVDDVLIKVVSAVLMALAFLFHTRVIDEHRDIDHDNTYHQNRPVQRGLITLKELVLIDVIGVLIFILVALYYGIYTTIVGGLIMLLTYVSKNDFFLGEKIRSKFLTYNFVNLTLTLLLQTLIHLIFLQDAELNTIFWLHLFFVFSCSMLIEFVRKIKLESEESTGKDTYSWYFGFNRSLLVYALLVVVSYSLFMLTAYYLDLLNWVVILIAALLTIQLLLTIYRHYLMPTKKGEGLLILSTLLAYIGLHLSIYFTISGGAYV